jgi:hypothetical protein
MKEKFLVECAKENFLSCNSILPFFKKKKEEEKIEKRYFVSFGGFTSNTVRALLLL